MKYARCYPVVRSSDRTTCSVQVAHICRTSTVRRFESLVAWSTSFAIVAVLAAIFGSARG